MMKEKYILANWKSHKTMPQVESWLNEFSSLYRPVPNLKVILAPPAIYIAPIMQILRRQGNASRISLAIQDLSPFPLGSYTGEIAAEMVKGLVDFAILGHSERRRYFHETNQDVANKVSLAQAANIRPVVCVDLPYAKEQLAVMDEAELTNILIGYGPVEAIGIDIAQSTEKVSRAIEEIHSLAPEAHILYGGSVNKENAADYLGLAGIAGLMVGTASLDAKEFAQICTIAGS